MCVHFWFQNILHVPFEILNFMGWPSRLECTTDVLLTFVRPGQVDNFGLSIVYANITRLYLGFPATQWQWFGCNQGGNAYHISGSCKSLFSVSPCPCSTCSSYSSQRDTNGLAENCGSGSRAVAGCVAGRRAYHSWLYYVVLLSVMVVFWPPQSFDCGDFTFFSCLYVSSLTC